MKNRSAIVGVGHLEFSKDIGRPENATAIDAIMLALNDAGLHPREVDGLVRSNMENTLEVEIARNLGIENLRFFGEIGYGGGGGCGTVAHAAMAIASGRAEVVVCWRARNRGSGGRPWAGTRMEVGGDQQFYIPFGLVRPVDQIAMLARRHMHEFGTETRHFGEVAVAFRKHAQRNPYALMQKAMTLEDHANARFISEPLGLFDCCLETDGALAIVVTTAERARDLKQPPAYIMSAAQATGPEHVVMANYHQHEFLQTPSLWCARDLFGTAGVQASDIDVAQFYDAFSPLVVLSLEEFGFCKPGEGGPFVENGGLQWPDGRLPCNTSGGCLSEAYVHGYNLMIEATRQIRGTSTCQVDGAELSLVTSGAGVPTSALILAKEVS